MKKWIQKIKLKKGELHKLLGIQEKEKIPKNLLNEIKKSKLNEVMKNPSKKGKRKIKVTKLLKKKVNLAINLGKVRR